MDKIQEAPDLVTVGEAQETPERHDDFYPKGSIVFFLLMLIVFIFIWFFFYFIMLNRM